MKIDIMRQRGQYQHLPEQPSSPGKSSYISGNHKYLDTERGDERGDGDRDPLDSAAVVTCRTNRSTERHSDRRRRKQQAAAEPPPSAELTKGTLVL